MEDPVVQEGDGDRKEQQITSKHEAYREKERQKYNEKQIEALLQYTLSSILPDLGIKTLASSGAIRTVRKVRQSIWRRHTD